MNNKIYLNRNWSYSPDFKNEMTAKDFSAENKNNEIRFRNSEVMRDKIPYIPNSEKMVPFIDRKSVV